jgi:Ca2+-binding EF-hand superfamily protein
MVFFKNIFSGTPASQYDSYFTMMDVDGNGTINKSELIMFLRENCA